MTRDAYQNIRAVHKDGSDLLPLQPEDLYITTLVLGAEQIGQCNTQKSWIWGFGKTLDDEVWMNECQLFTQFI